jgi:hypothetical protein
MRRVKREAADLARAIFEKNHRLARSVRGLLPVSHTHEARVSRNREQQIFFRLTARR